MKLIVEWGEYKGNKLIVLSGEGRRVFQFGKSKAGLLLEALEGENREEFVSMLKELVEGE